MSSIHFVSVIIILKKILISKTVLKYDALLTYSCVTIYVYEMSVEVHEDILNIYVTKYITK